MVNLSKYKAHGSIVPDRDAPVAPGRVRMAAWKPFRGHSGGKVRLIFGLD
jgi:hypothetical protein